jgi:hypothetical protein
VVVQNYAPPKNWIKCQCRLDPEGNRQRAKDEPERKEADEAARRKERAVGELRRQTPPKQTPGWSEMKITGNARAESAPRSRMDEQSITGYEARSRGPDPEQKL